MKKIVLISALIATVSIGSIACAAPNKNPQAGDLKANVNYGFDQKEGSRGAHSRFSGGDITYTINDKVDLQYVNNYTKGDDGDKLNEHYLQGVYRFNPYVSAYGGMSYVKADTYRDQHFYGYQVGLKGQIPIGERWQGFASVGVGDDVNSYSVGVGYDITKDWDAHIMYRRADIDVDNYDDTVKGWQIGMGYKF